DELADVVPRRIRQHEVETDHVGAASRQPIDGRRGVARLHGVVSQPAKKRPDLITDFRMVVYQQRRLALPSHLLPPPPLERHSPLPRRTYAWLRFGNTPCGPKCVTGRTCRIANQ